MGKNSGDIVVGYRYFMGMHMAICRGPVDSVQKIIVGEREAWAGNVTSNQSIYIDKPDLFGGEQKEGGIQGTVDVAMGASTQTKNTYLQAQLGTNVPAFRGVVSLILNQVYVCAMSVYPKPWAVKVKRIPAKTWYNATADINGSANPIHVIYETMTDTSWGMGYPVNELDDASFRAAALTCFNEGLGVSMLLTGQMSCEDFIYDVLGHCNGMLYARNSDGKFAIKLLREDYVPANLPIFNQSNIQELHSYERPSYGELVNEVVVKYRPQGALDMNTVAVQDLAAISAQGAVVSHSVTYSGCDTIANANRLAMRDLRQKSTPLARIRITVARKAFNLNIGDSFKFSWSALGVTEVICRILSIDYGTLQDGAITIDAVEDVFGFPTSTYAGDQGNLWVDPVQPASNFVNMRSDEANYYQLTYRLGEDATNNLDPTAAFLVNLAAEPANYVQGLELWTRPAAGTYAHANNGSPAGYAQVSAIGPADTVLPATFISPKLKSLIAAGGVYAVLNDEVVRIDSVNVGAGTVTVGRGCVDTVPASHAAGSILYIGAKYSVADPTEYAQGGTVDSKMLMRTSIDLYPLASATQLSRTFVGRQYKPYPPGKLRLTGSVSAAPSTAYPTTVTGDLTISWAHRNRLQQALEDESVGNITSEAGVTYSLRVYVNAILTTSVDGLTTTSYAPTIDGINTVRVDVWSVRGGITSYQTATHTFTHINTGRILTEAGDNLATEAGDLINKG